jgi:hypothetical protein
MGCVKPLTPGICYFIFIYDITFGFTGSPFVMGFQQNDCFNHTYRAIVRCRIGSARFS